MTVWRYLGRGSAILVGLGLTTLLIGWPVWLFGWNPWTALYVGFMVGRFMLFEFHDPVLLRRTYHREVSEDDVHMRVRPDDVR